VKRYSIKQFTEELLPHPHARGTESRGTRGEYYPVRYPATTIPWRNFRFRKPKHRPAPYTIQRWVGKLDYYATVRASTRGRVLQLRRPNYMLRRLEKLFPLSRGWANRQWESLDVRTATGATSRLFGRIIRRAPSAV
jgi:hypothetical protein